MFSLPVKPETIGKTLDAGFRLYFKSFKYIIPFATMFAIVGLMPSILNDPASTWDQTGQSASYILKLYGIIFIAQLINNIFIIAMLRRMHSMTRGEVCSVGEAFKTGLRKFIPMIFLNILYTMAWLAGMILLIAPGVFLSVAFIYSGLAMVIENRGPIDALGRSWDMVRNNWWRTMVIISVAMMIYLVIISVLGFVFGVTVAMSSPDSWYEYAFLIEVANAVLVLLILPLLAAIMIVGFNDLVLRREGADLDARIMELGQA